MHPLDNRRLCLSILLLLCVCAVRAFCSTPSQAGIFYVAEYSPSGSHTDYDMARQAADAYAATPYGLGSILILKPGVNYTCDAVPLPSLGSASTTSILGLGSAQSSLVKSPGCAAGAATLSHLDSPNGALSRGFYQGFTVDANHIDSAGCALYGMSLTTLQDIACGDAAAGSDHELEFGNTDANQVGWMDNIYVYNLRTFDSVSGGAGAVVTPVWTGSRLTGVSVLNGGASAYTAKYTRMQVFGPDLPTCLVTPTLTPLLGGNGRITGATITGAGSCASTTHLYILVQDGTPVTYGAKFTNMADSHVWGVQASGSTTYGEAWLSGSKNNTIYNEQPGSNQVFGILDNGNGNRHLNPVFVSPGGYAAALDGQNGTLANPLLTWSSSSYVAASGYYFGNDSRVYQDWMVQNSTCGGSPISHYLSVTTERGVLSNANTTPAGAKLEGVEACDGSRQVEWAVASN